MVMVSLRYYMVLFFALAATIAIDSDAIPSQDLLRDSSGPFEFRQSRLQALVPFGAPADELAGASPHARFRECLLTRFQDSRVTGEIQVIVAGAVPQDPAIHLTAPVAHWPNRPPNASQSLGLERLQFVVNP